MLEAVKAVGNIRPNWKGVDRLKAASIDFLKRVQASQDRGLQVTWARMEIAREMAQLAYRLERSRDPIDADERGQLEDRVIALAERLQRLAGPV